MLLYPNGHGVTSRQHQPWPMAALLRVYHLGPYDARTITVALSLMPDEVAALTPGRYRLTHVQWGQLTAPEVEVLIADA
jgi:hypothetical protein